jgi:hypothetical protein
MLSRVRDRLTYANVISTLALFVALGGGAYAAVQLPPRSVGTKQLKNKAVKPVKIARRAVTRPKIANDAVNGSKVAESTLGRVPEAQHANRATDSDLLGDHTFGYFEAAGRTEFGSGNAQSVQKDKLLEWPEAHFVVTTDGNSANGPAVIVRNTAATGGGPLAVVKGDGSPVSVAQGAEQEISGTQNLELVVARPDGRTAWIRCAFPSMSGTPVRCLGERSAPS